MTDQTTETPAPAAETGTDARLDRLESAVESIKDMLGGGSKPAAAADDDAGDVKAETRRAVEEVKRREAARARRDADKAANDSRLAAIEKAIERKPAEYRKGVAGWWQRKNGWHDDYGKKQETE